MPFSEAAEHRGAWLVLLYQVPGRSSSVRVRVWRRLQSIGAIQLRQSAYVLPHLEQPREDLEWLRAEIIGFGGKATVFAADTVDAFAHDEIVEAFRATRAHDLAALAKRGDRLLRRLTRAGEPTQPGHTPLGRTARAFVEEWRALVGITFFDTPGSADLEAIVQTISQFTGGRTARSASVAVETLDRAAYARRRWVTRPRPGVDRMSSAWLIRKFIDPDARFDFAERPTPEAVPFDMFGVEFGHQGDACTFEVLCTRFGIDDPAVRWIGRLVHDLDLRDGRFNEPEMPGVGLIIEGLRHAHPDDRELLERGIALFESLAKGFPGRATGAAADTEGRRLETGARESSKPTARRRSRAK